MVVDIQILIVDPSDFNKCKLTARCWSGQLNEGDVVLKLLRAVELRMDVDGGDRKIGFAAVIRLQMPFTDTDLWI